MDISRWLTRRVSSVAVHIKASSRAMLSPDHEDRVSRFWHEDETSVLFLKLLTPTARGKYEVGVQSLRHR